MTTTTAQDKIRDTVTKNDVVLFMKGTKTMPQCGFSSRVAGVLNYLRISLMDHDLASQAAGLKPDEAARQKELKIDTVRSYIRDIYTKLQVQSRTDALNKVFDR